MNAWIKEFTVIPPHSHHGEKTTFCPMKFCKHCHGSGVEATGENGWIQPCVCLTDRLRKFPAGCHVLMAVLAAYP
jgi:hypothetical protein